MPSFGSTMENVTVIKGRDASFTCVVLNIGPHRVRVFFDNYPFDKRKGRAVDFSKEENKNKQYPDANAN